MTAGFGLGMLLILVLAIVGYRSTTTSLERARWVTHTQLVLGDSSDLLSDLQDAETGQRGYLITGLENYLEPYKTGIAKAEERRKDLVKLTADNPNQQRRLTDIEPLIRAKLAELQQTIDVRRTNTFEAAKAIVVSDQGKKVMDGIRKLLTEMNDEEEGLLKKREAEAAQSASTTYWTLALVEDVVVEAL